MQIVASHRERRRDDGSLSIDAVLILGDVEYVLERNCASRRWAQRIADEELRLIRRLVLARLRQLHSDKQSSRRPLTPQANEVSGATSAPIALPLSEPLGSDLTPRSNGHDKHSTLRKPSHPLISAKDL